MYSTYEVPSFNGEVDCESRVSDRKKVIILGGGPNRIGQGIEFDYCCCHAAFALADIDIESIMVNCNPETVSTDYDTSDRLYFEPLTEEDVLELVATEQQSGDLLGVIVQFGGQTPLKLAESLEANGIPLLGTVRDALDRAEDRERFKALVEKLGLRQPNNAIARTAEEAEAAAEKVGYPVVLRPSNVLGGRGMEIVEDTPDLRRYVNEAVKVSGKSPLLIDQYLRDAIEVDVDAICDGEDVFVAGVMEHIEEAGVHSGDSACSLPPYTLSDAIVAEMKRQARVLALELGVVGLMNIQFAVKDDELYVIEVNPHASRTVPFVSKSIGIPLAKLAAKIMVGEKLVDLGFTEEVLPPCFCVKEAVFPWGRFPGIDIVLGPEMKSTGEVMGADADLGMAYAKSQISAFNPLPKEGNVFFSVNDRDKDRAVPVARELAELGFKIHATGGTFKRLEAEGIEVNRLYKLAEQKRPNVIDMMKNGDIDFIINTPSGHEAREDEIKIRSGAVQHKISHCTNLSAAEASVKAIRSLQEQELTVTPLQEHHGLA